MSTLSRYNHFHRWQNGYRIAYNAFTGAVALMTDENYAVYGRIVEKLAAGPSPELTEAEAELFKQLEHGGFVRSKGGPELEVLRFQHYAGRYDRTSLGLVIAPTMACNMACVYCFEEKTQRTMAPPIREAVIAFVEKQAKHIENLSVDWYGGEPLLALDVIEELTKGFIGLAERYLFEYSAGIVTNGYLLTPETVDRLVALRVNHAQVTLDGPARIHNVKRPMKSKRGSFDRIIGNLKYASTKLGIGIRVNIDKSFTKEIIAELLEELKAAGLEQRVGVYFGMIEPSSQVCANISEACYETADFSQVEVEYFRMLLAHGFRIDRLPAPLSAYCMATGVAGHLIDPEGYLYRCWNYAGSKDKAYGRITDEIDYQHENFQHLFKANPFDHTRCIECNLLPICMGGCPARRNDRGLSEEQMCAAWKHNLQPMLEIIALSKQQEMQRRQQQAQEPIAAKE